MKYTYWCSDFWNCTLQWFFSQKYWLIKMQNLITYPMKKVATIILYMCLFQAEEFSNCTLQSSLEHIRGKFCWGKWCKLSILAEFCSGGCPGSRELRPSRPSVLDKVKVGRTNHVGQEISYLAYCQTNGHLTHIKRHIKDCHLNFGQHFNV